LVLPAGRDDEDDEDDEDEDDEDDVLARGGATVEDGVRTRLADLPVDEVAYN
jgi:hypothetical protein